MLPLIKLSRYSFLALPAWLQLKNWLDAVRNRAFQRWVRGSLAILVKDIRIELRARYVLNALLIFVLSALLIIALTIGARNADTRVQSGLLWIVMLFAASLGLGRSFVIEAEQGTALLLRLHAASSMVYAGKLAVSFLILLAVCIVLVTAFLLLLGVQVSNIGILAVTFTLGALGLSGTVTLLAALIARASRSGPLLPVLLFPLLILYGTTDYCICSALLRTIIAYYAW